MSFDELNKFFNDIQEIKNEISLLKENKGSNNELLGNQIKSIEGKLDKLEKELQKNNHDIEYFLKKREANQTDELMEKRFSIFLEVKKGEYQKVINLIKQSILEIREENFDWNLRDFFQYIKKLSSQNFVFIYSGTTFIQDVKGYRPVRLGKEFVNEKIPTLFSFYRWDKLDFSIEDSWKDILFQTPRDLTIKYMNQIISADVGPKRKILLVEYPDPDIVKYIDKFKLYGWTIVYDILDDWDEFYKVGQANWYSEAIETYLCKKSDLITAVSKPLVIQFEHNMNKRVELLPNALDKDFIQPFSFLKNRTLTKAKQIVGYVGHMTKSWFDWDRFLWVANQSPDIQFELIGHTFPTGIVLPSNVKYLGPMNHSEVMNMAKTWSAAIIPFQMGKLADGVDPIKVYEYLAMGLPVVSFTMPQIHDYPEVSIATTKEEFLHALNLAVQSKVNVYNIYKFLEKNTWEVRVKKLLQLIEKSGKSEQILF